MPVAVSSSPQAPECSRMITAAIAPEPSVSLLPVADHLPDQGDGDGSHADTQANASPPVRVEDHLSLAAYHANRFRWLAEAKGVSLDDLVGEAFMALVIA